MDIWLYIPLAALIVAVISAYFVYRRYLVSKREPAAIAITALVKNIHDNPIEFTHGEYRGSKFGGGGGSGRTRVFNLFEIGSLNSLDDDFSDWDTHPVVFAKGSNYLFEIDENINDPNLPGKIATELEKFRAYKFDGIKYTQMPPSYMPLTVIRTNRFRATTFNRKNNDPDYKKPENIAFESWKSFKVSSENLTSQITKWGQTNGMEFNLRIDYNNPI